MGFQSQFQQQQQPQQTQANPLSGVFAQAQQLAAQNGGAQNAIQHLVDSGATCTMPSGRQMSVSDIVTMAQGKTPQQLLLQLLQS